MFFALNIYFTTLIYSYCKTTVEKLLDYSKELFIPKAFIKIN